MRELKSTSNQNFGKALEELVATYLINKGYSIHSKAQLIDSVQVDLIVSSLKSNKIKILLEIKSDPGITYRDRIHSQQIQRLKKAAYWFSKTEKCEVQVWVVFIAIPLKREPFAPDSNLSFNPKFKLNFVFLAEVDGSSG